MTVIDWLEESYADIREHGLLTGGYYAASEFGIGVGRRLGKRANYGRPYWERDWDVLVMVDACRWDLMQEVAPAWDFLPDSDRMETVYSPASMSEEWLERHVTPEYADDVGDTALVSANAFTRTDRVQDADWAHLDEVWRHSWSEEEGTVLPRPVTESAAWTWRNVDADRMIVWYLQPHGPFVQADWSQGFDKQEIGDGAGKHKSVWYRYRDGEIGDEQLWRAYRQNLNYVLEDVALLLANVDAETVAITSDHGNCLGEFGAYGHPKYVPIPALKRVPWVEKSATDRETITPEAPPVPTDIDDNTVDDRLRQLGYL